MLGLVAGLLPLSRISLPSLHKSFAYLKDLVQYKMPEFLQILHDGTYIEISVHELSSCMQCWCLSADTTAHHTYEAHMYVHKHTYTLCPVQGM